jgi:LCP family protein required for cell wall assembly
MIEAPSATAADDRRRPAWLGAALSFLFPGLGQALHGRRREALIFAVPIAILVLVVLAALLGILDPPRNTVLSSGFLIGVLLVNVAVFVWRSAAIAHAGLTGPRQADAQVHPQVYARERRLAGAVVGGLLLVTVAMHAWVGVVVMQLDGTLSEVFTGRGIEVPPPAPTGPVESVAPGATEPPPEEYRWDGTERINILLLGTDAAPGREVELTDVILAVSVNPVDETAVMVSVPRDTGFVPLPDTEIYPDARYPEKVNELMAEAVRDSETWCPDLADDAQACGVRTVQASIGLYLGMEIHHYALVDMSGFADLIDALGGLRLCLPGELVDPEFDGSLENEEVDEPLVLPAGCHQYTGIDALAYARSRKGWIELPDGTREPQSDFARAERQQAVLLVLRRELAEADTFLELPGVLSAIGRTVSTDFPRDQAGDLASLVPLITGPDIEQRVLGYPDFVDLPAEPDLNYLLVPNRDAIRDEMADIFGARALRGWYLATNDDVPDDAVTGSGADETP